MSGQKVERGGGGLEEKGDGSASFQPSPRDGSSHPIFEPLEGAGHNSFWLGIIEDNL